mmetsp:Transcript_39903/g.104578  ORF Transcript_39903/g.104578 Transcript_39903/m.104578 type:complete len:342 (-) Transcript_39903:4089-5114(-)
MDALVTDHHTKPKRPLRRRHYHVGLDGRHGTFLASAGRLAASALSNPASRVLIANHDFSVRVCTFVALQSRCVPLEPSWQRPAVRDGRNLANLDGSALHLKKLFASDLPLPAVVAPFRTSEDIPGGLVGLSVFALDGGDSDLGVKGCSGNGSSLDVDSCYLRTVVSDLDACPFPRLRRGIPPYLPRESDHADAAGKLVALRVRRGLHWNADWRWITPLPHHFGSRPTLDRPMLVRVSRHALNSARATNNRSVDMLDLCVAKLNIKWRAVVHFCSAGWCCTELASGCAQSGARNFAGSHVSKSAAYSNNIIESNSFDAFAKMIRFAGLHCWTIRWQFGTFQD